MPDPILRPYRPDDRAATVAMQCRAVDVLGRSHYTAAQIALLLAATEEPAYAAELLAVDLMLAVRPDGAVLGSAGWGRLPGAGSPGRIRKVFVEPALAGRGLGRHLVEAAEARARAAGAGGFVVRANLNAVAFYCRLGYRETGPGSLRVGSVQVPMTMMEKPNPAVG